MKQEKLRHWVRKNLAIDPDNFSYEDLKKIYLEEMRIKEKLISDEFEKHWYTPTRGLMRFENPAPLWPLFTAIFVILGGLITLALMILCVI